MIRSRQARPANGTFEGTGWRAIGALIAGAEGGDPDAAAVLDDTVDYLGAALGSLVNLYNPDRIILGGWVGLRFLEPSPPAFTWPCKDTA